MSRLFAIFAAFAMTAVVPLQAQPPERGGGVEIGPDDKPAYPPPPAGFDRVRDDIARGKTEVLEYESKTVGAKRLALVYTPPGYSSETRYPVLYLLHGLRGDQMFWHDEGLAHVILDNLYAEKKLEPMIVVFPNGRAMPDDRPGGPAADQLAAFLRFEQDLLQDLIPFIESKFSVLADRDHRALAGQSMGGGQALNFGLNNLDKFAWIAGFSPASNLKPPELLVPDPDAAAKLKLLWVSCGDQDRLLPTSRQLHAFLQERNVPHIWHVGQGAHDFTVWKVDLYWFSQQLFRDSPPPANREGPGELRRG